MSKYFIYLLLLLKVGSVKYKKFYLLLSWEKIPESSLLYCKRGLFLIDHGYMLLTVVFVEK